MNTVEHCFPLNSNPSDPSIHTIQGILEMYQRQLPAIRLSGPTYFGPVLKSFNHYAKETQQHQIYQILLILTDGEIHDMAEVKELIVQASDLPTSVIIVGVGNEDFELMEELDCDGGLLKDDYGRSASRDIV